MCILGEVIGTGIIGAIVSYPVMTLFWGKTGLTWFSMFLHLSQEHLSEEVLHLFFKAASESKAFIKIPDSTWFKCI